MASLPVALPENPSVTKALITAQNPSFLKNVALRVSSISLLTLLILGGVAVLGGFAGSQIGWLTMGLGGGGCVLHYFAKQKSGDKAWVNKAELVVACAMIVIGLLAAASILSSQQVGQGVLSMFLIGTGVYLARKGLGGNFFKPKESAS